MKLFNKIFPATKLDESFQNKIRYKKEINKWLKFIKEKGEIKRYLPRLQKNNTKHKNAALVEIGSAFLLEKKLEYKVVGFEEKTNNQDVDIVIEDKNREKIYCEVKGSTWESELSEEEIECGRKKSGKYINAECRSMAPWEKIRNAIKKSYSKFLPNSKNLLIICDNLFVNILNWPDNIIDIALYEDKGLYNNEKGYFVNSEYKNIGGIFIWKWQLEKENINYEYKFFKNSNADKRFSLILEDENEETN